MASWVKRLSVTGGTSGAHAAAADAASAADRAVNCVCAAAVGDAATMPSHWIYDAAKLSMLHAAAPGTPEFLSPPSCPFYSSAQFPGHYALGQPSPYGEEALALAEHLEGNGLELGDGEAFARSLHLWVKGYSGRKNGCSKQFEANMDELSKGGATARCFPACGANDSEANALWKVPLLAARYSRAPDYLSKVAQAVRAHQNTDGAEEFALSFAKMLRAALDGAKLPVAVAAGRASAPPAVAAALDKALKGTIASAAQDGEPALRDWLAGLGKALGTPYATSCAFPQSFIVAVKVVMDAVTVHAERPDVDLLAYAVRRNLMVGGDQCGRVALVAGLVGACGHPIPAGWAERTKGLDRLAQLAAALQAKGAVVVLPPEDGSVRCYLTFDAASGGTLSYTWSVPVLPKALAFFRPTKPVPAFKLTQNAGRNEIIRNLQGGTGEGMKRYLSGWLQFLKLARDFAGALTVLSKDADVYYLDAKFEIAKLPCFLAKNTLECQAIAALPPDNGALDICSATRELFLQTGSREGAAVGFY
jgi:hypothetical protein